MMRPGQTKRSVFGEAEMALKNVLPSLEETGVFNLKKGDLLEAQALVEAAQRFLEEWGEELQFALPAEDEEMEQR